MKPTLVVLMTAFSLCAYAKKSSADTYNFHFDKKPSASASEEAMEDSEESGETPVVQNESSDKVDVSPLSDKAAMTEPAPEEKSGSIQTRIGQTPIIINNTNTNPNTNHNIIKFPQRDS